MFNPSKVISLHTSITEAQESADKYAKTNGGFYVVMARSQAHWPQNAMVYRESERNDTPARLAEWSHWSNH